MRLISLVEDYNFVLQKNIMVDRHGRPTVLIDENKKLLLVNGDNDVSTIYAEDFIDDNDCAVTISFRCLARFFTDGKDPKPKDIKEALNFVEIIDFTEDEEINSTKCPGLGFVRLWGTTWHKSASVLLKNINSGLYILMGVDEDQYFACEFEADDGKNIVFLNEAYKYLMPKHIRETPQDNIRRQGEWFFIKLEGKPEQYVGFEKIPFNCDATTHQYILKSRNDHPESNIHVVEARDIYLVNDTFKINNGNKIPIFYNSSVYHNQHAELLLDNYWWPIENTAIRSFSEEGVD